MLIRICPDQTLAMRTILKNSEPLSIQAFRSKCLIYLFVQACILGVCASGYLVAWHQANYGLRLTFVLFFLAAEFILDLIFFNAVYCRMIDIFPLPSNL